MGHITRKTNTIVSLGLILTMLAIFAGPHIPSVYAAVRNFVQGGNSFGELGILGTLDNFGLSFITNGIEKARIDSAGNVGIGTLNPEAKLNIVGGEFWLFNQNQNPRMVLGDSGITGQYGFAQWDSLNDYYRIETDGTNGLKVKGNNVSIGNIFPSEPLIIGVGTTELFRVNSGGMIGVGTAAPSYKLDVQGGQINSSAGLCISGDCKTSWSQVQSVPAGQNGHIQFNNSGVFGGDNNFFWDNTNKRLGIGTLNPNNTIQVADLINFDDRFFLTSLGFQAGRAGSLGTFVGHQAGFSNTGAFNTAVGFTALYANTTGEHNVANGSQALRNNTVGGNNTAVGSESLKNNITGIANTANGVFALGSNTDGDFNTAIGYSALSSNRALFSTRVESNNTAVGAFALSSNATGANNTALGYRAGNNFANANITGSNNVFIGYNSGPATPTQISNATAIGTNASVSKSNSMVLGGTGAYAINVGIGTITPNAKLQIEGGDVAVTTQGNGIILKATDGPNCYQITVNNAGILNTALVSCP